MKKRTLLFLSLILVAIESLDAQEYIRKSDMSYISTTESDEYRLERCKLDIYYPKDVDNFATLIWFHGGGLTGGEKHIPELFLEQGFAVVAVNYRLYPRAKSPSYLEDCAEATAWVFNNIEKYGGDASKIFMSGHSAGGYLTLMLTLDKDYLSRHGVDANNLAASFPISGQTLTHFTIRRERGLNVALPVIDEYAPVHHARGDAAPLYLITGERQLEMKSRFEENILLKSILTPMNQRVTIYEMDGFDHGSIVAPACALIRSKIKSISK